MRSLLASYYNRRSLRLDDLENKFDKETISSMIKNCKSNINISQEKNEYFDKEKITVIDSRLSKNDINELNQISSKNGIEQTNEKIEQTFPVKFDLNLKFIDEADSDSSSSSNNSSDMDDEPQCKNAVSSNECQIKLQENLVKELEKLNKNFETISSKHHEKNINDCKKKLNESLGVLIKDEHLLTNNNQEINNNLMVNDIKICLAQIRSIFYQFNENQKKLNFKNEHKMNELNLPEASYENLKIESKQMHDKITNLEDKIKQDDEEIKRLREAFDIMQIDRKRLKCERLELISQTKDLYKSLETKENELRDFFIYYEKKTQETSNTVKKLIDLKAELKKERDEMQLLINRLNEEKKELKLVLESKNITINKLQKDLYQLKTKSSTIFKCNLGNESDCAYSSCKSSNAISSNITELTTNKDIPTTAAFNIEKTDSSEIKLINNYSVVSSDCNLNNKLNNFKQKIKKEERNLKCKSNESSLFIKKTANSNQQNNKFKVIFTKPSFNEKKTENDSHSNYFSKKLNSKSSINLNCNPSSKIIDFNQDEKNLIDLNKEVLNSDGFIDLDDYDFEEKAENEIRLNNCKKEKRVSTAESKIKSDKNAISFLGNIKELETALLSSNSSDESSSEASASSSSAQILSRQHLDSLTPTTSISSSSTDTTNSSSELNLADTSKIKTKPQPPSLPMPIINQYQIIKSKTLLEDEDINVLKHSDRNIDTVLKRKSFSNLNSSSIKARSSRLINSIKRMSVIGTLNPHSTSSSSSCSPITKFDQDRVKTLDNSKSAYHKTQPILNLFSKTSNSNEIDSKNNIKNVLKFTDDNDEQYNNDLIVSISSCSFSGLNSSHNTDYLNNSSYFGTNIEKWTPNMVKIWLENLGMMPLQIKNGIKFVKNGKELVSLSDIELDKYFFLNNNTANNHLHKRKLRLAIDELKYPEKCKYPKLNEITNSWLTNIWLKQIGLVQFQTVFKKNLIDGRVLASLQRKDLEKHLGISKRNLQTSILLAINLLKRFDFDIIRIESMRNSAKASTMFKENQLDINFWSNNHFLDWLKLVKLEKFSINLNESGIHGALVADNSFNVEFLYNCLNVNDETRYKNMKKILDDEIKLLKKLKGNTLHLHQHHLLSKNDSTFQRPISNSFKNEKRSFTLRGSLSRALGKKIKRDISIPLVDDETYKRIEHNHKIVDMKDLKNN